MLAITLQFSRVVWASGRKELERSFRMPLWPVSPVIALVGVGIALTQQKGSELIIVGAILVGGIIYYLVFPMPRSDRYRSHLTVPEHELKVAAAQDADS